MRLQILLGPTVLGHPISFRLGSKRFETADQELDRQTIGIRACGPIHELVRGAGKVGEVASEQPFHRGLLAVGVRRKTVDISFRRLDSQLWPRGRPS